MGILRKKTSFLNPDAQVSSSSSAAHDKHYMQTCSISPVSDPMFAVEKTYLFCKYWQSALLFAPVCGSHSWVQWTRGVL